MDEIYHKMNPWWDNREFDAGLKRAVYSGLSDKARKRKQIEIIAGSRRTGKTTLMKQLIKGYLQETRPENIFYINLEDPAVHSVPVSTHIRNFRSGFGHRIDEKIVLFFDEAQESPDWEAELKSVYDSENVKMFVTGSTSHMIAMRGGKLTGRQATTCVYPLSFPEYLEFKGLAVSGAEEYIMETALDEYLQQGGYPEKTLLDPPDYMQNLIQDVITRDIIRYFKPRKDREVFRLFSLVCSALGTRVSYSRFSRVAGISVDTVKEYIGYFETAYLVSSMEKYSDSANDRVYANKKLYLHDTAFKTAVDIKKDAGAKAENALYMYLHRKNIKTGYFAESDRELDFVAELPEGPVPIESKYTDELEENDARLGGLKLYVKRFAPKRAIIATRSVKKNFLIGKTEVSAVPLWKILAGSGGV